MPCETMALLRQFRLKTASLMLVSNRKNQLIRYGKKRIKKNTYYKLLAFIKWFWDFNFSPRHSRGSFYNFYLASLGLVWESYHFGV